jgi:hypothetical protein
MSLLLHYSKSFLVTKSNCCRYILQFESSIGLFVRGRRVVPFLISVGSINSASVEKLSTVNFFPEIFFVLLMVLIASKSTNPKNGTIETY